MEAEGNAKQLKFMLIVVILAILAATLIAAFFASRTKASDRIELEDVVLIQKFLETYKLNYGVYPQSSSGSPVGYEKYLESLPKPPKNSDCPGFDKYVYTSLSGGSSYSLQFCLNNSISGFTKGLNQIGPNANVKS